MYKWYIQCMQHDITILNRYQRWNRELIANNETIYHTSTNNVKHKKDGLFTTQFNQNGKKTH